MSHIKNFIPAPPAPSPPEPTRPVAATVVDQWNALHPVGTLVRFWPDGRDGLHHLGLTASPAVLLSPDHASVKIEGRASTIDLENVQAIAPEATVLVLTSDRLPLRPSDRVLLSQSSIRMRSDLAAVAEGGAE